MPRLPSSPSVCKKSKIFRRPPRANVPSVSVFVETANSWGRRVVKGIIEFSKLNGPWHIDLHTKGGEAFFSLDEAWKPDGIIVRVTRPAIAKALRAKNVPIVNCSGIILPGYEFPTVTGSYAGDARVAADHFWARGFSHFAYVGRMPGDADSR